MNSDKYRRTMNLNKSDNRSRPPPPKNYHVTSTHPKPPHPPPPRFKNSTNQLQKQSARPVAQSRTVTTISPTKDSNEVPKNFRKKPVNNFTNPKGKKSDNQKQLKLKTDVGQNSRNAHFVDKSPTTSVASTIGKIVGRYKQLNRKIKNIVSSTNKKFKVASATTNDKINRTSFIDRNCRWLLLISSRIILFLVELFCIEYLLTWRTENTIFLSYIPLYGCKSKISIASIITCSCFTNLMGVTTAIYHRNVTIWSRSLPAHYMILMTCQIVALLIGFSVTGVALKNLNESLMFQDMLPVLKEFRTQNDLHYFVDRLQNEKSCCGITGPRDWRRLNLSIPRSCCNNHNCSKITPPSEHLHMYGCYNYIVDDAETELQLLLTMTGSIIFLQIPVFFVTCLTFPNMKILRRFFKARQKYDSELSSKLISLQSRHTNIQNSNIKSSFTFPIKTGEFVRSTSVLCSSDKISLDKHFELNESISLGNRSMSNSFIYNSPRSNSEEVDKKIRLWLLGQWLPPHDDV